MNRAVPAIILVLAAVIGLILKAPPKVRENLNTYYKTLIQAPAAQMTQYTTRTTKPRPEQKPAVAPPPKARSSNGGPNITVLGGVTWDRKTRPATNLASHPEKPAESGEPIAAVAPPAPPVEPAPAPEPTPEPALVTQQ